MVSDYNAIGSGQNKPLGSFPTPEKPAQNTFVGAQAPTPVVSSPGLPEVDSPSKLNVDLNKFKGLMCVIVGVEGSRGELRIKNPNASASDGKAHVLRIVGDVVHREVIGNKTIEVRPTELISLVEDKEGNLLGLPKGENSKWQQLKRYLNISRPEELIGKALPMTVSKKGFLTFLYG